jgi:predicted RNA-binding Zn-ribbon protein involved in translation (DUF1610 family)
VIILAKAKKKAGKKKMAAKKSSSGKGTAYCVKCRKKITIKNPKKIKMANLKIATKGVCPKCGTKVFRIGG